jgi:hypothetical protein
VAEESQVTSHLTREDCRTIAHELRALTASLKRSAEDFANTQSMARYRTLEPLLNELGDDGLRLYGAVLADRTSCCCVGSDCDCLTWRSADYPLEYVIEADMVPAPPWRCQLQIVAECSERADLFITDYRERRLTCTVCYQDESVRINSTIEGRIEWTTMCDECGADIGTINAAKHNLYWSAREVGKRGSAPSSAHVFRPRPRVIIEATGKVAPEPRREGAING